MKAVQEKFVIELEAVARAKELSRTDSYVIVIESKGEYFVENETAMIRIWERVVVRFINGKEEKL